MPIQIIKQDITKMQVDVIVNPTDAAFSGAGGVDQQIHIAAGAGMDAECAALSPLAVGDVRATAGHGLPCRYVIHTVGPVWEGGGSGEALLLRSCYLNALLLAQKLGAKSVAFPLISSGTYGFPKDRVLRLAQQAISDFLYGSDGDLTVYICVIDRDAFEPGIAPWLRRELDAALQGREARMQYAASVAYTRSANREPAVEADSAAPIPESAAAPPDDLGDWLKKHDDSFAVTLLKLIDKKGMTDVECYKKANVSRKTFSKINTDKDYRPSKQTVIAFAVALRLDLRETEQLLKTVGFSLSGSYMFDRIIEFCIRRKIYDITEINEILYKYDQVCLGC